MLNHDIIKLNVADLCATAICACGKEFTSSAAFPGDNVERKVRTNHLQHVKRVAK